MLSRVARVCIGWLYSKPYDRTIHDREDLMHAQIDPVRRQRMVQNHMAWIVKRGADISNNGHFLENINGRVLEYEKFYSMEVEGIDRFRCIVYESPNEEPPSRYREDDPDVRDTGRKIVLQTPVPVEKLPTTENDKGEPCRVFCWKWNVRVEGAAIFMEAFSGGKKVGELSITDQ